MTHGSLIVVVAGPTCTGKSTFSSRLAKELNATLLSQDQILSEILPHSDRNLEDRMKSYDVLLERATQPVVMEGTFSRVQHRSGLAFRFPSADFLIVELEVPLNIALERFSSRQGHPATDLTEGIVKNRNDDFPYSGDVIRIDGRRTFEEQAAEVNSSILAGKFHDVWLWKSLGRSALGTEFSR